jgi:hypothetical protein
MMNTRQWDQSEEDIYATLIRTEQNKTEDVVDMLGRSVLPYLDINGMES